MKDFLKELIIGFIKKINLLQFMTAFTVMTVFGVISLSLVFREIPAENKEIIIHIVGMIEGAVMAIVGYEFYKTEKNKES